MRGACLSVLFAIICLAGARATAADLRCTPTLPVFCANVHVGCAGRTKLPTLDFTAMVDGVVFEDGSRWSGAASVSYSGAVYRRAGSRDWIRIDTGGAFSQRVYRDGGPMMAYGVCE